MSLYLKYLRFFQNYIKFDKYDIYSVPTVLYDILQPYINNSNFNLAKITSIYPIKSYLLLYDLNTQILFVCLNWNFWYLNIMIKYGSYNFYWFL